MPDESRQRPLHGRRRRRAVAFYTTHLGFELRTSAAPAFADVTAGHLRLLLSGPASSAGRPMPDGRTPGARRLEPHPPHRRRHRRRGRAAARGRARVPQRHRHRPGRPADPARRPRRQPDRALPARRSDTERSEATHARRSTRAAVRRSASSLREWGRASAASGSAGRRRTSRCCANCASSAGGWLSPEEFEDAIAATQPPARTGSTQLAIYCAWRVGGVGGRPGRRAPAFILPGLGSSSSLSSLFLGRHAAGVGRRSGRRSGRRRRRRGAAGRRSAAPSSGGERAAGAQRARWVAYVLAGGAATPSPASGWCSSCWPAAFIELAWRRPPARDRRARRARLAAARRRPRPAAWARWPGWRSRSARCPTAAAS